jgi:hypothetical protein
MNENEVIIPTSEFELEKNQINRIEQLSDITNDINNSIEEIFNEYLRIGKNLAICKNEKLYLIDGFKDIYDYALERFNLAKTTVYNVITISEKFTDDRGLLLEEYEGYSYSSLVELVSVPKLDLENYKGLTKVSEIRSKKKEIKFFDYVEKSFKDGGLISKIHEHIKSFDYYSLFGTFDIRLNYTVDDFDSDDRRFHINYTFENLPIESKNTSFEFGVSDRANIRLLAMKPVYVAIVLNTMDDVDRFLVEHINALLEELKKERPEKTKTVRLYDKHNDRYPRNTGTSNEVASELGMNIYYDTAYGSNQKIYINDKVEKSNQPVMSVTNASNFMEIEFRFEKSNDDIEFALAMLKQQREAITETVKRIYRLALEQYKNKD